MTQAEFETCKRDALQEMAAEWDRAWQEKRHGELYVGAYFSNGVPGDLVVTGEKRHRRRKSEDE